MKKTLLAAALGSAVLLAGCGPQESKQDAAAEVKKPEAAAQAEQALTLETEIQKVSYSLGLMVGEQLAAIEQVDFKAFNAAVQAVYKGEEPKLTPEQVQEVLQAFQTKMEQKQVEEFAKLGEENLKKGQDYLAENGKKEGVTTTDSGLQIEMLRAGEGKAPTAVDTVKVHYKGTLLDGTQFDSSYDRNEPISFPLNGVIPGWVEGLQLMAEGSKARLVIPSDLAYGEQGTRGAIGPNETLIFEVELLAVNPDAEPTADVEQVVEEAVEQVVEKTAEAVDKAE